MVSLPANTARARPGERSGLPPLHANLLRLVGASFLMGAASTALWSFGGEIATARLDWSTRGIGLL